MIRLTSTFLKVLETNIIQPKHVALTLTEYKDFVQNTIKLIDTFQLFINANKKLIDDYNNKVTGS